MKQIILNSFCEDNEKYIHLNQIMRALEPTLLGINRHHPTFQLTAVLKEESPLTKEELETSMTPFQPDSAILR